MPKGAVGPPRVYQVTIVPRIAHDKSINQTTLPKIAALSNEKTDRFARAAPIISARPDFRR